MPQIALCLTSPVARASTPTPSQRCGRSHLQPRRRRRSPHHPGLRLPRLSRTWRSHRQLILRTCLIIRRPTLWSTLHHQFPSHILSPTFHQLPWSQACTFILRSPRRAFCTICGLTPPKPTSVCPRLSSPHQPLARHCPLWHFALGIFPGCSQSGQIPDFRLATPLSPSKTSYSRSTSTFARQSRAPNTKPWAILRRRRSLGHSSGA